MLRIDHLFENFELAKYCLQYWEHDDTELLKLFQYFRVSSNAVYPFKYNGKVCYLRMAPVEEKNFQSVQSEVDILNWLNEQSYSAMKPIASKDGEHVKLIDSKWGKFIVSCFERVSGRNLEDGQFNAENGELFEVVRKYGQTLGKLHSTWKDYPYPHHRENYMDLLTRTEKRLDEFNGPHYMKQECQNVRNELMKLENSEETFGLVHYDFEADNVFYDSDTKQVSVIDFDDMITCWYALDVVRAIDCLEDVIGQDDEEMIKKCSKILIEGYRSEKSFSEEQFDSLDLMRRVVRISEYAGLLYTLSGQVEDEPDWMVDLRESLTNTTHMMEQKVLNKN